MKTKFFSIIMALLAFAWSSAKAQIADNSLYIDFKINEFYQTFYRRFYFPATGFEEQVYDEHKIRTLSFSSIHIRPYEPNSLKSLTLHYRINNPAAVVPTNDDGWHDIDLFVGEKLVELDFRDDIVDFYTHETFFLIDPEWVVPCEALTLELYFDGVDASDNHFFHNNGGENYKITFKLSEDIQKIKFGEVRSMMTTKENESYNTFFIEFDKNGGCSYTSQLGLINTLYLDNYTLSFSYLDGERPEDISLQYRIYEEGHEEESGWNRLEPGDRYFYDEGKGVYCTFYREYNLTDGLVSGKDYVFEFFYQVVQDRISYVIGSAEKGSGTKLRFTYEEEVVVQPFKSATLSLSVNGGETEELVLPESGYPETVINEPVHSFQFFGAEIMADETIPIQEMSLLFNVTVYEKNNPEPVEEFMRGISCWDMGLGLWVTDMSDPWDIVRDQWKNENYSMVIATYLEAQDAEGNWYRYNNGGESYKYTFNCGEGGNSSANGLKEFTVVMKFNGEEIPIEVPASDGDDIAVPFKLSSLMLMGAELTTDQPMQSVSFKSKTYSPGQQNSVQWKTTDFVKKDDNTWRIDFPYGKEIIEDEWLGQRLKKTFEFFVSAENAEGSTVYYNNDDLNYRISFQIDETVGVNEVAGQRTTDNGQTIFNLVGQRMSKMQKGINIVDGKKILVK